MPDIGLKESVKISNWASAANAIILKGVVNNSDTYMSLLTARVHSIVNKAKMDFDLFTTSIMDIYIAEISYIDKPYKFYNRVSLMQQVTLTRIRTGSVHCTMCIDAVS